MVDRRREPMRGEVVKISSTAFGRLLALREQEMAAARAIADGDGYSDFFVEGGGPPWHEAFTDVITGREVDEVSQFRMAYVDRATLVAGQDGYSDFFVEGGGPPWHEAFTDVITGREELVADPRARTRALANLRTMEAFARLRERAIEAG